MRTILFVCWLALPIGALVCGLDAAGAQEVNAEQACTPDAMRLCSAFIPDRANVTKCMMAKRRQLSTECRTAMAGGHRAGGVRRVHGHHVRHSRHHG